MNRAIFLDRDGTINQDLGDICSKDKLVFIPQALGAIRILKGDFLLFIITNQSGIGKNIFSEEEFLNLNDYFLNFLKERSIKIEKVYYCPHTKEEDCLCRKPKPYFLRKAEKDYNIDLKKSYVIGDHPHDIEMAHRAKAGSIYLLTGHGRKHVQELSIKPDFIAHNLYEAAIWIMERSMINQQGG
ncbi:MAG: D-glycero-alpha-D-manno-heptose-1,7-bisphosphate 7-phosphatase [bacterium]